MYFLKLPRLAQSVKASSFVCSSLTRGERLVADAWDHQPFEPGEWGLRVVRSGHFCASLQVGHAKRRGPVLNYRLTSLEAQTKTKQTNVFSLIQNMSIYFESVFGTKVLFSFMTLTKFCRGKRC